MVGVLIRERSLKGTKLEYLKGIFLNGLKDVVKGKLKLHQVSSLRKLMDYAQRIDEKNTLRRIFERSYTSLRTVTWDLGKKGNQSKSPEGGSSRGRVLKRLSKAELQEKASKGLCFHCDEKFGLGHVCNKGRRIGGGCRTRSRGDGTQESSAIHVKHHEVDLKKIHQIVGRNYRSQGSGVGRLWSIPQLYILCSNKREMRRGMEAICLAGSRFRNSTRFLHLRTKGVDIVLGMEWLARLGEIRANSKDLTLNVPTPTAHLARRANYVYISCLLQDID
ncbi:hypothetical protein CR513_13281, partial [Mucuna pruriens]